MKEVSIAKSIRDQIASKTLPKMQLRLVSTDWLNRFLSYTEVSVKPIYMCMWIEWSGKARSDSELRFGWDGTTGHEANELVVVGGPKSVAVKVQRLEPDVALRGPQARQGLWSDNSRKLEQTHLDIRGWGARSPYLSLLNAWRGRKQDAAPWLRAY